MERERLYQLMSDPDQCNPALSDALESVVRAYPYFHTARLLYTKSLSVTSDNRYREELAKTALFCPDRRQLFYLIYHEEYRDFLEEAFSNDEKEDRTALLLDSFLSSIDEKEMLPITGETAGLSIVSSDYFSYLELQGKELTSCSDGEARLKHQELIDAFIEKTEADGVFKPDERETAPSPSQLTEEIDETQGTAFLTETLAKIYIKQKKYAQALTIIRRLSLNFPKKSAYFADQIRFLELLTMNEQNKNS